MPPSASGSPEWYALLASRAVSFAAGLYFFCIAVLIVGMELAGERLWPLAILLYLPQQILLLPLMILVPAALLAGVPRWAWALMGGAVIIFLWHTPLHLGLGRHPRASGLRVMTNNYAQNHGLPLQPWIAAEDPDIIALEDASGMGGYFQRAFPDRFVSGIGQFVLISKTPIREATLLLSSAWTRRATVARFEITWQGRDIAVYSVHLPTPRGDFARLAGLGLLREMLGRNRSRSDGLSFQQAMEARVSLASDLAGMLAREKRPCVVMGDFNMPSNGYVHRIFASVLTDAFATAGRGFGFTFPGDARNPLSLFEPWLRIDYVFAGPGWRVEDCRVQPGRRSKHRPVFALLSPV